jgi:hypothetical protein
LSRQGEGGDGHRDHHPADHEPRPGQSRGLLPPPAAPITTRFGTPSGVGRSRP